MEPRYRLEWSDQVVEGTASEFLDAVRCEMAKKERCYEGMKLSDFADEMIREAGAWLGEDAKVKIREGMEALGLDSVVELGLRYYVAAMDQTAQLNPL